MSEDRLERVSRELVRYFTHGMDGVKWDARRVEGFAVSVDLTSSQIRRYAKMQVRNPRSDTLIRIEEGLKRIRKQK